MRIDSYISFNPSKVIKCQILNTVLISLVRGWKEKIDFDHSWELKGKKPWIPSSNIWK